MPPKHMATLKHDGADADATWENVSIARDVPLQFILRFLCKSRLLRNPQNQGAIHETSPSPLPQSLSGHLRALALALGPVVRRTASAPRTTAPAAKSPQGTTSTPQGSQGTTPASTQSTAASARCRRAPSSATATARDTQTTTSTSKDSQGAPTTSETRRATAASKGPQGATAASSLRMARNSH